MWFLAKGGHGIGMPIARIEVEGVDVRDVYTQCTARRMSYC
jgi:hypothetical protein